MIFGREFQLIPQDQRQHHEGCSQNQVQRKNTDIKAQQFLVAKHPPNRAGTQLGVSVKSAYFGGWHYDMENDDTQNGKARDEPEQALESHPIGKHRAKNHGDGEGEADTNTNQRHRFGAVLFTSQIRSERHHHRGNRSRSLQGSTQDNTEQGVRKRCDSTPKDEQQKTKGNDRLPAQSIRPDPKRNLE